MKTLTAKLITSAKVSALACSLTATSIASAQANDENKPRSDTTAAIEQQQQQQQQIDAAAATNQERPKIEPQAQPAPATSVAETTPQQSPATAQPTEQPAPRKEDQAQQAAAQPAPAQTTQPAAPPVRIASEGAKDQGLGRLNDRNVLSSDGKELGEIKDFLIEPTSSKVAYGVVSSGGIAGIGDKLYLVPFSALESDSARGEFRVRLDSTQWERLAPLNERDYKSGRVTISDSQRRQIDKHFNRPSSGSEFYTSAISSHLVRASDLRGKDVHVGRSKVGEIEEVIVDTVSGAATALFESERNFAPTKEKYLVPLNRLAFGTTKDDRISTMLSRADFEQALSGPAPQAVASTDAGSRPTAPDTSLAPTGRTGTADQPDTAPRTETAPQQSVAATDTPAKSSTTPPSHTPSRTTASETTTGPAQPEPELTPTGKTSADQTPAGDPALVSAAQAIRSALDQDESLARADVRVAPENGKLVLRGKVKDAETKKSIEEKAKDAAQGASIDSQITVEDK